MKIITEHKSPNHSARSKDVAVDTIMLHSTGGGLEGALSWLTNPESQVSAHFLIARDGKIYKLVNLSRTAWHAGKCNVPNANLRSIGIEIVQLPEEVPSLLQWSSIFFLIHILRKASPSIRYLVGHKEWNSQKMDPYNVNMGHIRGMASMDRP